MCVCVSDNKWTRLYRGRERRRQYQPFSPYTSSFCPLPNCLDKSRTLKTEHRGQVDCVTVGDVMKCMYVSWTIRTVHWIWSHFCQWLHRSVDVIMLPDFTSEFSFPTPVACLPKAATSALSSWVKTCSRLFRDVCTVHYEETKRFTRESVKW